MKIKNLFSTNYILKEVILGTYLLVYVPPEQQVPNLQVIVTLYH